jgi:acetyl esterase/lipase
MRVTDLARLGMLAARIVRPHADHPPGNVVEERDRTSRSGLAFDRYRPVSPTRRVVVAVHGVTVSGKDHPDLRHFARSLAATGATCVTPTLPGLSEMLFAPSDVDALTALVEEVSRDHGRPVVLVGFCYGASFALLAASRAGAAEAVHAVISIGAYHDLATVVEGYLEDPAPGDEAALDDRIYRDAVLAYRHRNHLGLDDRVATELRDLLGRFCCQATGDEKRSFHERHLDGLDLLATDRLRLDPAALAELSPAGKLAGIRCPVALLHDPVDRLVPVREARRLHRELTALPDGARHRLLVTPLMSHVRLSAATCLTDVAPLLRLLAPLVGD